jgi:hypothetical protein
VPRVAAQHDRLAVEQDVGASHPDLANPNRTVEVSVTVAPARTLTFSWYRCGSSGLQSRGFAQGWSNVTVAGATTVGTVTSPVDRRTVLPPSVTACSTDTLPAW